MSCSEWFFKYIIKSCDYKTFKKSKAQNVEADFVGAACFKFSEENGKRAVVSLLCREPASLAKIAFLFHRSLLSIRKLPGKSPENLTNFI